jgi:hypothetical protein
MRVSTESSKETTERVRGTSMPISSATAKPAAAIRSLS